MMSSEMSLSTCEVGRLPKGTSLFFLGRGRASFECDLDPQLKHWPSFGVSCLCLKLQLAPFLQPAPSLKKRHGGFFPFPEPFGVVLRGLAGSESGCFESLLCCWLDCL